MNRKFADVPTLSLFLVVAYIETGTDEDGVEYANERLAEWEATFTEARAELLERERRVK